MLLNKLSYVFVLAGVLIVSNIHTVAIANSQNQQESTGNTVQLQSDEDNLRGELGGGPNDYNLSFNLPDPFDSKTTIRFAVPSKEAVSINVYNNNWQVVRTLVSGVVDKGYYKIEWDGKDDQGAQVADGIYYYRLKAENFDNVGKMFFLAD